MKAYIEVLNWKRFKQLNNIEAIQDTIRECFETGDKAQCSLDIFDLPPPLPSAKTYQPTPEEREKLLLAPDLIDAIFSEKERILKEKIMDQEV